MKISAVWYVVMNDGILLCNMYVFVYYIDDHEKKGEI